MFIHGRFVDSISGEKDGVFDPATGELTSVAPVAASEDVDVAVKSAVEGFEIWRKTPAKTRAKVMHQAAALIKQRVDEFAESITFEMGKPIKKSRGEVLSAAELFDYFAEEGIRLTGDIPQINHEDEQVLVYKEPVGVVGAITPSNYPIALLTWKLGAALAAGCSLVAKPDEHSPSASILLADVFFKAGLPAGVFNVITGGAEAGNALVMHPDVRKIAFTGSLEVGRIIAANAASTCKRVSLELGGQCPAIVMDDVVVDEIIKEVVEHAYNNSGQYCYRINRVYVHEKIYEEFMGKLVKTVANLKLGPGNDPQTDLGPLAHEEILKRTITHIEDAVAKGASIRYGGKQVALSTKSNLLFEPTIIENADHTMLVMKEETFGPVLAIKKISSLREGVTLANDTIYGLAAYVFTQDVGRGLQAAREIESGSVWVNRVHKAYEVAPFGGVKQSGYGREKSKYGLDEYIELKAVYLALPVI